MQSKTKRKIAIGGGLGLLGLLGLMLALADDDDPDPDAPFTPRPSIPKDPFVPVPAMPGEPPRPPDPLKPAPATPKVDPKRVIDDFLAPGTRTNTLYQIKRGDYPALVARRALDGDPRTQTRVNAGHPALDDYIRAITRVLMNVNTYGVYWTPEKTWGRPKYETIEDEDGDRLTIHFAYLPQNWDNLTALRAGLPPKRTYSLEGTGGLPGGYYGLLFLPNAFVNAGGALVILDDDVPEEIRQFLPPEWYA